MFHEKLRNSWAKSNTFLCVGIDPDLERLPTEFKRKTPNFLQFGKAIVDAVNPYVCAFKINYAHFGSQGEEASLAKLIAYVHDRHPEIPVILDAKRGDIDSTARRYAEEVFSRYDADAVTVNPFLGWDTLEPYLNYEDRGVVVLCKTSNPGASWLQDEPESHPAYVRIAEHIQGEQNPNLLLVVGATHPHALRRVRETAPDVALLVPGVGSQGGSVDEVLEHGRRADGLGLVVNCSRSVIYPSDPNLSYAQFVANAASAYSRQLAIERE